MVPLSKQEILAELRRLGIEARHDADAICREYLTYYFIHCHQGRAPGERNDRSREEMQRTENG